MRVNGINNYNIYNVPALNINGKTHSYNIKLNDSKDIITFGAKRKPPAQNISKNSKEAFQLGKRVYSSLMFDPTKQKALEIITNEDPSLKIYDIEELKNEIPNAKNYSAYLRSYLNPDYTVENLGFYINLAPLDENDKTGKMKFAMETAHEYTHVRQNANGDSARYLKNIAGENEEYAEFLAGFGKCVFEYFDGELQAMFVSSVIDEKDIPLIQKYNILCPKEKLVTKQMMFKKYGFKISQKILKNQKCIPDFKNADEYLNYLKLASMPKQQRVGNKLLDKISDTLKESPEAEHTLKENLLNLDNPKKYIEAKGAVELSYLAGTVIGLALIASEISNLILHPIMRTLGLEKKQTDHKILDKKA